MLEEDSSAITLVDLDLGNRELYGHGIGMRLLQRIVEYGIHKRPHVDAVSRGVGNWALVMTLGKVLGGVNEHVQFQKGDSGNWYGAGTGRPVEAVFETYPAQEDEEYNVKNITGFIDPATLMSAKTAIDCITTTIR